MNYIAKRIALIEVSSGLLQVVSVVVLITVKYVVIQFLWYNGMINNKLNNIPKCVMVDSNYINIVNTTYKLTDKTL